jgi:hypothetical protein
MKSSATLFILFSQEIVSSSLKSAKNAYRSFLYDIFLGYRVLVHLYPGKKIVKLVSLHRIKIKEAARKAEQKKRKAKKPTKRSREKEINDFILRLRRSLPH